MSPTILQLSRGARTKKNKRPRAGALTVHLIVKVLLQDSDYVSA